MVDKKRKTLSNSQTPHNRPCQSPGARCEKTGIIMRRHRNTHHSAPLQTNFGGPSPEKNNIKEILARRKAATVNGRTSGSKRHQRISHMQRRWISYQPSRKRPVKVGKNSLGSLNAYKSVVVVRQRLLDNALVLA